MRELEQRITMALRQHVGAAAALLKNHMRMQAFCCVVLVRAYRWSVQYEALRSYVRLVQSTHDLGCHGG